MSGALVVLLLVVFAVPAAAARPNEDETAPAPGLFCLEPVAIPDLVNVIDARWSPDGEKLAVVRFVRIPSSRASGYVEDETLSIVDMKTKQVRSLGSIQFGRPTWSPSGKYLAYWGNKADFLEVMDSKSGEVVAKLTPSNPEFRWQGDTLLYIQASTIRAWKGGKTPETLGRLGDTKVPHLPDDAWQWSGDASRFTLTRYDEKDPTPERFVGITASQDASPIDLPGARYTEWAPAGSILLVRYQNALEIRDFDANTVDRIAIASTALYDWAGDGRTLLVRAARATVAAGDVYEEAQVVWPTPPKTAILPDLFGVRRFSPNGRYFGGTVRTATHDNVFAAFRCYEIVRGDPAGVPVPFADRFAKIDAGTNRLLRPASGPISTFFSLGHQGVDVAASVGSPIVASDAGVVTAAGWQTENEGGNRVCVSHGGGLETCYYHISAAVVSVGRRVARGEVIALVGQSGVSNGAHVHWDAKLNGKYIDPLQR